MNDANDLKVRLPLPKLMALCGDGDRAKKSARCPFHDDSQPSFSVFQSDGSWFFKCHAGCGEGDEVNYLEKKFGLSTGDAFQKYRELAGLNGNGQVPQGATYMPSDAKSERDRSAEWQRCTEAFCEDLWLNLKDERKWSEECCQWLRQQGLVGVYEGHIALPIQNEAGLVVGWHYRLNDGSWRYYPTGCKVRPLVFGNPNAAETILAFESQWDLFSVADLLGWHRTGEGLPDWCLIATRGACNAKLAAEIINAKATVYIFGQNDPPGQKWLHAIADLIARRVKSVKTPPIHKDPNEWTRAGATLDDMNAAMETAADIEPSVPTPEARLSQESRMSRRDDDSFDDPTLQPFPIECLPGAAGQMARAIAECERVPLSLSCCCVLGIGSASIGVGFSVRSGPQRTTRGNLYIVVSAQSGTGKSESYRHAARPFHEYEQKIVEEWMNTSLPKLQAERDALDEEYKQAKKEISKEKDDALHAEIQARMEKNRARMLALERELQSPVLWCEDVTVERLAVILQNRGEVIASLSADAGNIVNNLLGRYNKLDRTDEGIYLKAYSGDYCRVDRVGRAPVCLQHPCVTALWLTQPDKLDVLLGERSLTEGGLIPRLLPCHSNCQPEPIPENPTVIPTNIAEAYGELIRVLLTAYRLNDKPIVLEPDPEVMELFREHHNALVSRRKGDLKDVTIFVARWTEQAWRISVVLHALRHGAEAHLHTVSAETARDAIRIADWFAAQQLNILSGGRMKARQDKRNAVIRLLEGLPEGITAREVQRARIVGNADEARELLEAMEQEGILGHTEISPERGGHTVRLYKRKATP